MPVRGSLITTVTRAWRGNITSKVGNRKFNKGRRAAKGYGEFIGGQYKIRWDRVEQFVPPPEEEMRHSKLRPYVRARIDVPAEDQRTPPNLVDYCIAHMEHRIENGQWTGPVPDLSHIDGREPATTASTSGPGVEQDTDLTQLASKS
eukprot:Clim_evm13s169 gene=Clim_evmTU13s169